MEEFLSFVIGIVAVVITGYLKGYSWPKEAKVLLTLAVCLMLAAVQAFFLNQLSLEIPTKEEFVKAFAVISASAFSLYKLYFESAFNSLATGRN